MTTDKQLLRALELLQLKVEKLETNDAIFLINQEIENVENKSWIPHYEVHKASLLRSANKNNEAAQLLQETVIKYPDADSANYFAGEYLLELGEYTKAMTFFGKCIAIEVESGEHWYLDAARLLRAFCAAKTGDHILATQDLDGIPNDEEAPWLSVDVVISKSSILSILSTKQ